MRRTVLFGVVGIAVVAVVIFALARPSGPGAKPPEGRTPPGGKVRPPAVAGMFYPQDADKLTAAIDGCLQKAKSEPVENLRALICPHAGYEFSGPTAAEAYKNLIGKKVRTVIVMGPSHSASFQGASIPDAAAYRTPLGEVPVSPKAVELAKIAPFACNPPCEVRRPGWSRLARMELPPFGQDTPHTWEHSVEVQIPFLQKTLKDFTIVPVVFGQVDPAAAARALIEHALDDQTLLVVSTDLSHFYPYDMARFLDALCIHDILELNLEGMKKHEACGMTPVRTLMHVARTKGWTVKLLDYANSGDTAGDKSNVVGYAAIAFFDDGKAPTTAAAPGDDAAQRRQYSDEERKFLLRLARKALEQVVTQGALPQVDPKDVPKGAAEDRGCFVTLNLDGRLRGCIGNILPDRPLYQAVLDNTRSAALHDKRFRPVTAAELAKIEIEISVLTVPAPLKSTSPIGLMAQLRPGVDGVILKIGNRQATFLPQVWGQMPNKLHFLSRLAMKAGLPPSAWQQKGVEVLTYQAEAFEEEVSERGTPGSEPRTER